MYTLGHMARNNLDYLTYSFFQLDKFSSTGIIRYELVQGWWAMLARIAPLDLAIANFRQDGSCLSAVRRDAPQSGCLAARGGQEEGSPEGR